MAGLSSIVQSDAMVITPEIILVVVTDVDRLNITNDFHRGIEASINRLAADSFILLAPDCVEVPKILVLGDWNMEESIARKDLAILAD